MPRQTCLMSAFCASEKRSPYCDRITWQRASASAALCGESLGEAPAVWGLTFAGGGAAAPQRGVEPVATAAVPSAARRANSRRESAVSDVFIVVHRLSNGLAYWAVSIIAQDQWR